MDRFEPLTNHEGGSELDEPELGAEVNELDGVVPDSSRK
jgi:hypothetical protein